MMSPCPYGGKEAANGRQLIILDIFKTMIFQTIKIKQRMGARAVEGTGLENRQGLTPLVGSNPTPSAIISYISISYYGKIVISAKGERVEIST